MDTDGEQKQSGPRSVLRVMEIIAAVAGRADGCTLTELTEALSLPKTSAFSLLKSLEGGGYLRQSHSRYLLGPEAIRLGASINRAAAFPFCVRPTLERLAETTGETIMLGALSDEGHEVTYVDIVESEAPLRFTVRIGNRRPLYAAASGKAILAFLPAPTQRAYLKTTTFVRFTPATSDRAALEKLLPEIRRRGTVLDADGIVDGAAAIAAPCFDGAGRVTCSLSIAGPTGRIVGSQPKLEGLILKGAEEVSRMLGHAATAAWPAPTAPSLPDRAKSRRAR